MALHWDLTKIKNNKQLCWIETGRKNEDGEDEVTLNVVTDALIWLTMIVDYPLDEEKKVDEFFTRVRMHEAARGAFLRQTKEYWAVTDGKTFTTYDEESEAKKVAGKGDKILKGEKTEDRCITYQDVVEHVGLKTNVYPESKAKFKNKFAKSLRDDVERGLRHAKEEMEKKNNIDLLGEAVDDGMA